MTARFSVFASLFASLGLGCGLIQVNGKPLGGSSSSPPPQQQGGSQAQAQPQPPQQQQPTTASSSAPTASGPSAPAAPQEAPGQPGKQLDEIAKAPAKMHSWTPVQQYIQILDERDAYPAVIMADELGAKLSHSGRVAMVRLCFSRGRKEATSATLWAVCAVDVEAMNLDGFATELKKEGIDSEVRKRLLDEAKQTLEDAKAIGAAVNEAAKEDAGVAAVVAVGAAARKDWQAFASTHGDQLALLDQLQDIARENKNGLGGDCLAKTEPAFAKVARSTKWSESDSYLSPIEVYVNMLPKTTDAYIAALAWGACGFATHDSGKALYQAVANTAWGKDLRETRFARRGPRTLAIAKLFEDPFKPKFVDRSRSMNNMIKFNGSYQLVGGHSTSMTPTIAIIAKLVKDGDSTTIKFSSDHVMACVDWRDTNKVSQVDSSGNVYYEKKCMKRKATYNEHSDVVTGSAFTNGLGPKVNVTTVSGFPVIGLKGTKVVAILGIKL